MISVHEAATSPTRNDLVYFSYYAAGFRVAKIVNDNLVEMGHYIDTGGNNFWGVQVFQSGGQVRRCQRSRLRSLHLPLHRQLT